MRARGVPGASLQLSVELVVLVDRLVHVPGAAHACTAAARQEGAAASGGRAAAGPSSAATQQKQPAGCRPPLLAAARACQPRLPAGKVTRSPAFTSTASPPSGVTVTRPCSTYAVSASLRGAQTRRNRSAAGAQAALGFGRHREQALPAHPVTCRTRGTCSSRSPRWART